MADIIFRMRKSTRSKKKPGWHKDFELIGRNKGKQREAEVPEDEVKGRGERKRGGKKRGGRK